MKKRKWHSESLLDLICGLHPSAKVSIVGNANTGGTVTVELNGHTHKFTVYHHRWRTVEDEAFTLALLRLDSAEARKVARRAA